MTDATPGAYFCGTCREVRHIDPPPPDPDWAFCPMCGTRMGDASLAPAYAGCWQRAVGFAIDVAVLFALEFVLGVVLAMAYLVAGADTSAAAPNVFFTLSGLACAFGYAWVGNANGGTIGKMAAGLKIVREDGGAPGYRRSAGRYGVSFASGLVFGLGYVSMIWSDSKQTLHDRAAGTYVIRR